MATRSRKAVVTYHRQADTLYITLPPCKGGYGTSPDGVYFFTFYDSRRRRQPSAFEIHHFSEVWNDETIIPVLALRLTVEGTALRDVTLREVARWAYQQFVAPKRRRVRPKAQPTEVAAVPA